MEVPKIQCPKCKLLYPVQYAHTCEQENAMSTPLGLVEKIGEQLWKLQHQTLVTGYNENHRDQQINLNTTTQAILQAVIEWAEGLIGEAEERPIITQDVTGAWDIEGMDDPAVPVPVIRAMLKELKGE